MTDQEKREAARQFHNKWNNRGKEKQDDQSYWVDFLQNIMGVENVTDRIEWQKEIIQPNKHKGWIDAYIPETKTIIEQKSLGIKLDEPQQGHDGMTPYEQAKMYDNCLPQSQKAKWIVVSNFAEIWVYDMDSAYPEPVKFTLADIPTKYSYFDFLINQNKKTITEETQISVKAGEFVGLIYDALIKQYIDPTNEESLKSLNMLCVRLVFCLYAEDAHIFGESGSMFHDYLEQYEAKDIRRAIIDLFKILDTPEDKRDKYDNSGINEFPCVNGGLFADENIEIPQFTDEIKDILLSKASEGFDWSDISPTIFGAVFESTLNPETRRSGGMHYTSIENIHKVIDPLFLDELKEELEKIKVIQVVKSRNAKLRAFQEKLANLKWLDPACGSGNFLTETYISIRRIENEVIRLLFDSDKKQVDGQLVMGNAINPIKVSINQFYGIEINDFAVTVARTALWIAESQMMKETEDIIYMQLEFLPLTTQANIVEGNALRIDWEEVVPKSELNYIMGNPPFVGMKEQSNAQKEELKKVSNIKTLKQMDYVAGWYFKAGTFIENTRIECAFVSSNSISQGEQALTIWKPLVMKGIYINFAYRTFVWNSEANDKANVHCVIIGFSINNISEKKIFEGNDVKKCTHIDQYLQDAEFNFVSKSGKPISAKLEMTKGAQLIDDGNFVLSQKEYDEAIKKEPEIKPYIKQYWNARDLLNNGETKYALYLENCPPNVIKSSKFISERVEAVYNFRINNNKPSTKVLADKPSKYFQSQAPIGKSLVIPVVSSQKRRYIPICFMPEGMVYTNAVFYIDKATIYEFGILESNVHMSWARKLCGRMKSDYRYSNTIVYNTFPWPAPTTEQKEKIKETAQGILDARALNPDSSLADLYDPLTMPSELQKAHRNNDIAVMKAYGFDIKNMSESDCVAELMKMYQELTKD